MMLLAAGYALGLATWAWCSKREPRVPEAATVVAYLDPFTAERKRR